MRKRRLWSVLVVAVALLMVSQAPALAHGTKGHHRPFGGEQVMALNVDLETDANLYGCEDISWFGTIELYGKTYGMALYSISGEVADDGLYYYEEGWKIFKGKFKVKDGALKRCHPGRLVAAGTNAGVWDTSTGYFESVGSVDYAIGRFRKWHQKTVMQNGFAPQPVSVAGLEEVPGLIGELWLERPFGGTTG